MILDPIPAGELAEMGRVWARLEARCVDLVGPVYGYEAAIQLVRACRARIRARG